MIKGKTESGFEFELDESAMNDMEVLDAIVDIQSGDPARQLPSYSILASKILGDNKKDLYNHVRDENGRVPIDAIDKELTDIFNSSKDGKN